MQSGKTLKWIESDRFWVLLLALLGCLTRIPFASKILYHWDSINYSLALKEFNISLHQPQPPGYILYVYLTRLVNVFLPEPQTTFLFLNFLFSTLAAIALYFLGKVMFDRRVGVLGGLFLLFSPLFWFYSEIALPNVIDAFIVTLIAYFFFKTSQGDQKAVWIAAILLGISGGFRQQTLIFMAPLAVYAVRKLKFSQMLLSGACATAIFLLSFIPMVMLNGGLEGYRASVSALSNSAFVQTSVFTGGGLSALKRNLAKLAGFTIYAVFLSAVPLVAWPAAFIKKVPGFLRSHKAWFLAIWALPSLFFYSFIHMGGHGLIFTYLPALIVVAAAALVNLVDSFAHSAELRRKWILGLGIVIVIADIVIFTLAPNKIPLGNSSLLIVNWQTVQKNDRFYASRFSAIQKQFDPAGTIVMASKWRHAQYYLFNFQVYSALCASNGDDGFAGEIYALRDKRYQVYPGGDITAALGSPPTALVFFDRDSTCILDENTRARLQEIPMDPADDSLFVLPLSGNEQFDYQLGQLTIRSK